jgi:hypothetical protein
MLSDFCRVEGEIVAPFDPCTTTTCVGRVEQLVLANGDILCGGVPIAPAGFDSSKNYFIGNVPLDAGVGAANIFLDRRLILYCGGSGLSYAILDGSDCVEDEGAVTSWDCATLSGYIDLNLATYPTADCCDGFGAGGYRIKIG